MSRQLWTAAAALLVIGLGGCAAATSSTSSPAEKPAKVEAIAGKNVKSVTLTEQAVKRVGVETTTITMGPSGMTVPYASVLYTPDGGTWVFVVTGARRYVREQIVVSNVGGAAGTEAYLSSGPAVGTTIVKTGAIELYGAELGVGK